MSEEEISGSQRESEAYSSALAESQEQYRLTFQHVQEVVYMVDRRGTILHVTPSVEALFGYSPEEVIGKTLRSLNLFPRKILGAINRDMQQVLAGKSLKDRIRYGRTKSGELRVIEGSAAPIIKGGEVIGVVGTLRDISVRTKMEDRLRQLSQAIEQTNEAVIITNPQGLIEYVNTAFVRNTGYQADEVIGVSPAILKSGAQDDEFYKRLWEAITKGESWQGSVVDRRKDGSFYPALLSVTPVCDNSGEVVNYVGIQQDISKLKQLEEQLLQSQKMEALGTLVSGIAHDFNNILAAIHGSVYLARATQDKEDAEKKLDDVERLVMSGAEMIRSLLTFARKETVEMAEVSLNEFLKEGIKLAQTGIPENVEQHLNICPQRLSIRGDAAQLQQVVMNLFNNARDAVAGQALPRIVCELHAFDADEEFLSRYPQLPAGQRRFARLSIGDNGCGISEERLSKVFEPFFTTKPAGKGTGLGLAMVFGSVQQHGGCVEVESEEGKGTSFHVYLPLLEEMERQEIIQDSSIAEGCGETVLVVDDDVHVLDLTCELLSSIGYRTLAAHDGVEGLNIFRRHANDIELLISDVVMPRMGGAELVSKARELKPSLSVVFMSGYANEASVVRGNVENSLLVYKPVPVGHFSQSVRMMLGRA